MAEKKITELPQSQTLSDTDYMFVNQGGNPVWVPTTKMKENAANAVEHPSVLPNPKKLKFTGAVTAEYDGSTEISVTIPAGGTSEGGTTDYTALTNKPQINNVELSGNKTLDQLGIQPKIADVAADKVEIEKQVVAPKVQAEQEIIAPKVSATTVEADNLYTNTQVDSKVNTKLDKNQGSSNAGKYLSVASNGYIQCVDPPNGGGGETSANIPRQEMQNTNTTVTLQPNILYVFPEMTTLTVTLATPSDNDIANEFHFIFISGSIATTLSLSNKDGSQIYSDTYSIKSNMMYEVSVLESIAYVKGVSNNA